MPIYEYVCTDCNSQFELLVASYTSRPSCPSCDSRKLQRKLSTFAAHQGASSSPSCAAAAQCPSAGGCSSGGCPFSA